MLHHFTVSNCSLREGFIDLIKNASKIFLFLVFSEALVSTSLQTDGQENISSGSSCSAHLKTTYCSWSV